MSIRFSSEEHLKFYETCMAKSRVKDAYHQALFYTMGISPDARRGVSLWFDFAEDQIKPEVLEQGWQTGGSARLTRLAFNLWNGFDDSHSTPYDLFDCGYAEFMLEGIKLRYPEFCHALDVPQEEPEL